MIKAIDSVNASGGLMAKNRPTNKPRFRRVLLKLSGEALMGLQGYGVDPAMASRIAEELAELHAIGVQVAATVGGGNIVRGISVSCLLVFSTLFVPSITHGTPKKLDILTLHF